MVVGLAVGLIGARGENDAQAPLRGVREDFSNGLREDSSIVRGNDGESERHLRGLSGDGIDVPLATPTPVPDVPRDASGAQGMGEETGGEAAGTTGASDGNEAGGVANPGSSGPVLDGRSVSLTPLGEIVASYSWPVNEAFAITSCESSWNPGAISWAGAYGLWQIYASTWASYFPDFWENWADPVRNTEMAWEIYVRAGYSFSPWDCY